MFNIQIQDQEQNLKFQNAITKGKWQIFVQVRHPFTLSLNYSTDSNIRDNIITLLSYYLYIQQLEKGSAAKKLKFFNMLVQVRYVCVHIV